MVDYWKNVAENILEWQEVLNKELTKKSLRENYIVTLAITISALGRLGRYFYDNPKADINVLEKLQKIDWARSNELWVGRTIRENGRVLNSEESVSLTCAAIKKEIGVPLSKEEEQKEKQFVRKK